MTAKPARPANLAAKPESPDSLVDSLQSEVASEASPLLRFLLARARLIATAAVILIACGAGYRFHAARTESRIAEETESLGRILVISSPVMRLEKLEAFLADAPASVKSGAWLAIMEAANLTGDNEKIYKAWEWISKAEPSLKVPAAMGMSGALAAQEKYREAIDALEAVAGGLKGGEAGNVYSRMVILAELLGDYKRAVAACDSLAGAGGDTADAMFWTQKKLDLEEKIAKTN
ncbi:MAG: hypothetical protein LBN33_08730 [Desulfovibrio sp.]|jgi:tetratricopeptide (TPR) repeat protein|nr:hypothetical protein [Desulfovibrio sp.]